MQRASIARALCGGQPLLLCDEPTGNLSQQAGLEVMQILKTAMGGKGPPEWLSTHPTSDTRINKLNKLITEQYPLHRDPSHYRYGKQAFQDNVLTPLSRLPRAKHRAAGFIGPEDIVRVAGITWEQATGAGCECHGAPATQ